MILCVSGSRPGADGARSRLHRGSRLQAAPNSRFEIQVVENVQIVKGVKSAEVVEIVKSIFGTDCADCTDFGMIIDCSSESRIRLRCQLPPSPVGYGVTSRRDKLDSPLRYPILSKATGTDVETNDDKGSQVLGSTFKVGDKDGIDDPKTCRSWLSSLNRFPWTPGFHGTTQRTGLS